MTLNQDFGSASDPSKKTVYIDAKDIIIDGEQMTDEKLHEIAEDAMESFYKSKGLDFKRMPYVEDQPTA
jgi:hypothetical protein